MFGLRSATALSRKNTAPSLDARTQKMLAQAERNTQAAEREIAKANAKLLAASMKADRVAASVTL